MGRSRGGLTTKIHMLADALGRPLRFIVTAGQVGDITQASALLDGPSGDAVLADKAYDSNALRQTIADMGAEAAIPSNRSRKVIIPHDEVAYINRNRIERCFNRIKHFRRFATRYDRRTIHFQGFIHLAATMICSDECRSVLVLKLPNWVAEKWRRLDDDFIMAVCAGHRRRGAILPHRFVPQLHIFTRGILSSAMPLN